MGGREKNVRRDISPTLALIDGKRVQVRLEYSDQEARYQKALMPGDFYSEEQQREMSKKAITTFGRSGQKGE